MKKILFVTMHDISGKIDNGGNQCSDRNLKLLQAIYGSSSIDTCIGSQNETKKQKKGVYYVRLMRKKHHRFLAGFLCKSDFTRSSVIYICNLIQKNDYQMIFFDGTRCGNIIERIKKHHKYKGKIVVFAHNVEKDILWQQMLHENILYFPLYFATKHVERVSLKYSNVFIALSNKDSSIFQKSYKRKADFILPITFRDTKKDGECPDNPVMPENSLLFTGSEYIPNVKGIRWFCKEVMPSVDIPLFIVGRGLEKLRDELESDKIRIIGTVDKLHDYLEAAGAVVIPIFYGGGMKVKTAEAIMHGKRIFATTEALMGYEIASYGMDRCDDAQSFIRHIKYYFENEGVRREIGEVRKLFIDYYDTERYVEPVRALLENSKG